MSRMQPLNHQTMYTSPIIQAPFSPLQQSLHCQPTSVEAAADIFLQERQESTIPPILHLPTFTRYPISVGFLSPNAPSMILQSFNYPLPLIRNSVNFSLMYVTPNTLNCHLSSSLASLQYSRLPHFAHPSFKKTV